jgi:hypothetical protein
MRAPWFLLAGMIAQASLAVPTAATRLQGFPKAFQGRWGDSPAGCSEGAVHGGLNIESKLVSDGEFGGDIKSVVRKADGSLEVVEIWDNGDESNETLRSNYTLSKDGAKLTIRSLDKTESRISSEPQVLIRCGGKRG